MQARLSSPLARFELATPGDLSDSVLHDSFATFEHSLRASLDMVSKHDFDAVVDLLSDPRRRVLAVGGRVSAFLARYLASQLHLIRSGVELIDPERSNPADHLVDVGRRDVLVVYDYRRYQSDTINSARVAAARGSTVVLVTDPWLSPAAVSAKFVLVTDVQTTVAPFELDGVRRRPHRGVDRGRARAPRRERARADAAARRPPRWHSLRGRPVD